MIKGKMKSNLKFFAVGLLTLIFMILVLSKPQYSMLGVKDGLSICVSNIIPALFPFCVLSSFFIKSGLCEKSSKLLSGFSKYVLRFPKSAAGAVLISLFAGYPVGAMMAQSLYERGNITKAQYKRMMLFCVNAGPAFVIGNVGKNILSSKKAGTIIFLSLTLGSLTVAFLSRFLYREKSVCESRKIENVNADLSYALNESVFAGVKSVISVCAWVVLFSCVLEFLNMFPLDNTTKDFIIAFSEVTRGCASLAKYNNIPLIVFIIGWAGVSVHFQIMKYIKESGLKISEFICSRFVNAGISSLYCHYLLKVFPCTQDVFGSISSPVARSYSVSYASALSMIIMGVFMILELDTKCKKC